MLPFISPQKFFTITSISSFSCALVSSARELNTLGRCNNKHPFLEAWKLESPRLRSKCQGVWCLQILTFSFVPSHDKEKGGDERGEVEEEKGRARREQERRQSYGICTYKGIDCILRPCTLNPGTIFTYHHIWLRISVRNLRGYWVHVPPS